MQRDYNREVKDLEAAPRTTREVSEFTLNFSTYKHNAESEHSESLKDNRHVVSIRSQLESQLKESTAKKYELTLGLERLQRRVKQVENLESKVFKVKENEGNPLPIQAKNEEDWNTWIYLFSQKQQQHVDVIQLIKTKINNIEMQIDKALKVKLVENEIATSYRKPPLTCEDSLSNQHVIGKELVIDGERGMYKGFLNSNDLPECHGIFLLENNDVYEG
jgi:hypothetical protein